MGHQLEMNLDYETRSTVPISYGLKNYHRVAQTLLATWRLSNGEQGHWDFSDPDPYAWDHLIWHLRSPTVLKRAYNAPFEMTHTEMVLDIPVDLKDWQCTMAWAYARSFSGTLAQVGEQVGIPTDKAKLADGKRLIKVFCEPPFGDPLKFPSEWAHFKEYNIQDVEAERAVVEALRDFPLTAAEQALWEWDRKVNERGVPIDSSAVFHGVQLAEQETERLLAEISRITGLKKPNSRNPLLGWLQDHGYPYKDLQKETVAKATAKSDPNTDYGRVLRLRESVAKASTKKLNRLMEITYQGRVYNTLQIWGAGRTGRWAGRDLQLHNLMRPTIEDPEFVADLLSAGYPDLVRAIYG